MVQGEGVAVVHHEDVVVRDAHRLGQAGVRPQVSGLAVDRHEVLGLHDGEHELELLGPGVAGDVDQGPGLVVHVGPDLGQAVDDAGDGLLVAGDRGGRDDHRIAGLDGHRAVLAVGHPGQRRERLALAAGAQYHDLLGREVVHVVGVDDVVAVDVEVPQVLGDLGVLHHGAAGDHHLAAAGHGGVVDLLDAVDVAREGGHDHPLLGARDDRAQGLAHLGLALGELGLLGVGGVAHHQVDAQVPKVAQGVEVGADPVDGGLVELEVSGVQHRAGRAA